MNINEFLNRPVPLTEAQKGIYFECLDEPDSAKYNMALICRLPDNTETERFINAVRAVAEEHPALRVRICAPDGVPSMIYCGGEIAVSEKHVENINDECREILVPFDLEKGPLYRFELCHTAQGDYFLYDIHHIIFDGTSAKILLDQIAKKYNGEDAVKESLTQFDVAMAEPAVLESDDYSKCREYFKSLLDGVEWDSRPVPDNVYPQTENTAGRLVLEAGDKFNAADVKAFTEKAGITENTLFLSAFAYTLAEMNGSQESTFCTVCAGRHNRLLSDSVGMFVKTLPVYISIPENETVSGLLHSVQDGFHRTLKNSIISFGELASAYGVTTDTAFVYQSDLFSGSDIRTGHIGMEIVYNTDIQADIDFMVMKNGNAFSVTVRYRKSLYTDGYIESLAETYLSVVRGMMSAGKLSDIQLTDEKVIAKLDGFNGTEREWNAGKTLVQLFREQAARTPDSECLVYLDRRYTYREVDEITDRLAGHLVKCGVGREKIVGVLIPRCEHMLICSLGIVKAGGAYMPMDPGYPQERLNLMMADSGAVMLIHSPEYADVITADFTGGRMSTDGIFSLPDCDITLPEPGTDDLFVLLYTSGSTGTPKGVEFCHSNAHIAAEFFRMYFDMNADTRCAAYASYGFDAHLVDIYPPVISGGMLHIIPENIRLDLPAVRDYFNDNGITNCSMTMQIGRQFALMGSHRTLRHLVVAGEKLIPLAPQEGFDIYNLYGPSEGSVTTSAYRIERLCRDVPIGKPIYNIRTYIVDKNGRRLPAGGVGELWVSGPQVTRGYHNRPEKTAEAYGLNPFTDSKGYERVYRTGDIVRMLEDGNMQFVGRRDAQVKIRGFRVELTEIEEVIRRFDGVKDATVAAFDEQGGGKYICAYVVSDRKLSADALADFIRAEKPPYMVPAVIMQIDSIPLNQNQKVNRRALPVPERKSKNTEPPENATQEKIFRIVSDILGHGNFGINTGFTEAGLTSIGSVRLNIALADEFGVPVRIADIKANDTVRKMEAFLADSSAAESFPLQDDYPITETQKGIFAECMARPDTTVYNIPVLFRLGKGVDITRLEKAVRSAAGAHPYIRTELFTDSDGNVRAKRNDSADLTVSVIRCGKLPPVSELRKPFRLTGEPLYRISIFETDDGNYLYMDFHHIICDGTSEAILLRDIDSAYKGNPVPAERYTGFEAALAEEKLRSGPQYESAENYWKELLSDYDGTSLPLKAPEEGGTGAGYIRVSGENNAEKIEKFCTENKVTPNAFFNAVFSLVLSRYTGRKNAGYATIYNGRSDSRFAGSFTMSVKTIPVSADTCGKDAADFIRDIQTQLIGSMSNDMCSFAYLANTYGVDSDIIFAYQGDDFAFDTLCGEHAQVVEITPDTAKARLAVNVYRTGGCFEYTVEYDRGFYCGAFAESMADSLITAVNAFLSAKKLDDVSLVSERAESVYREMNDTCVKTEDTLCHEFIERYAEKTPDAAAFYANGESLTFRELNEKANIMAHRLMEYGIGSGQIVGIVLDRTTEVIICELAVMKAGGAFLPMLPGYPDERIEFCLANAGCPAVITTGAIRAQRNGLFADGAPCRTLICEELLRGTETQNPGIAVSKAQLAYCIYTSGSTGTPKGVLIEHRNFSNFVQVDTLPLRYYSNKEADGTSLAVCSISFDMSLYEIWLPLCSGRGVCMATEEEFHNPLMLRDLMLNRNVQMMTCTPSFLNNMLSVPGFDRALRGLQTVVVGAEAFPDSLRRALHKYAPELQIINGYGPTETSICCSTKELADSGAITIGRPVGNACFYVLDSAGHIQPPYAEGELIICGAGVGRGYMKLPEKNAECFFTLRGLPAYRSGDRVRLTDSAEIEFGGRIDNQVKLRGFRVELDEIEKVMCAYSGIKQSKVLVRNNGTEDYLAGFYTATETVDTGELSIYLKSRLAHYMVPAVLMQLDAMPLTQNGKIDKNAFPETKQTVRRSGGRRAAKKSLEQRLCEVFASVLSLDCVYADDNFFELGGTSLSASKVTMILMSENIDVKYGDIFDNPTPESLAEFIERKDVHSSEEKSSAAPETATREALKWNMVKYAREVERRPLGNVLLTGAVGFLGIHILRELLEIETGHIYCLVRKGEYESAQTRLRTMLIYYFSESFDDAMNSRITVLDADITDATLGETLEDIPFDTVINCAACVKHFADDDILERINVRGVENLIDICKKKDRKLIQISTVSVPGIHTRESYEKQIRMHENELFVIDDMDNKYGISKYQAELRMFDAIESGMRGKVIRAGNLMGRHSDGEFQANMETNMFLSGIRGFATMGKYPISHMADPISFSPVDCSARAMVLLAGTNDKFTAFNCDNRYGFDEMKIIDACNRNGITILPADDGEYYEEYRRKLGDVSVNSRLNGLAAYDMPDVHAVSTDNLFTTNILYRIGFSWPLVDDTYLDRAIRSIMTLDYFGPDTGTGETET